MAILLNAASAQYLRNSAPRITTVPFTFGCWCNLAAVGTVGRVLMALSDITTTTEFFYVQINAGELVQQGASTTAGSNFNAVTTALTAGRWTFVVARFISATERRLSVLQMGGAVVIEHANSGTSRSPAGINTMTIGAYEFSGGVSNTWSGGLAEAWATSKDVAPSGGDTPTSIMHQLAFGGPFSIPSLAGSVVEYRSFRNGIASDTDEFGEVYQRGGRNPWEQVNGPITLRPHPQLPYWYQRPGQAMRNLVI